MSSRLSVCLLASESVPLSKTGGLADVTGALTKYLHGAGHDVRLFTPCYASVARSAFGALPVAGLADLPLALGQHRYSFSVLRGVMPGGAAVYLVDCPALYARPTLYTSDPDEHLRFLALTQAALSACQRLGWAPQIVHCNDWHTSFAPLFLRTRWRAEPLFGSTRTVLTIHNIGYQGVFAAEQVADLGLSPSDLPLLHQGDLAAGRINALRHGILYADAVTTVSPTYAREICTAEYGMGLEDSLRARAAVLSGILNGVDYEEWDPRRDRYLPAHYDEATLAVKLRLKHRFLQRQQLDAAGGAPLAGLVSRLASQKGIDLLAEVLPDTLRSRPLAFVALGTGEPRYAQFLRSLQAQFPGRVRFHEGYDDELAHWIEAASDLFLMPSRYEPCGLNQMYSLRYGTLPLVRRTGGLADSVQHFDPASGSGTGIVFNDFNAQGLKWGLDAALDLYQRPAQWLRAQKNAMQQDFSWARQGAHYVALYRKVIAA
ncbi:MAG: glycogen synthase [Proteobacteria bacterium]|nr:glycogen synthase [Pseudomonadota bacterium]